ncbi:hypothetical protein Tco_0010586 [Tanacetum coccineum]
MMKNKALTVMMSQEQPNLDEETVHPEDQFEFVLWFGATSRPEEEQIGCQDRFSLQRGYLDKEIYMAQPEVFQTKNILKKMDTSSPYMPQAVSTGSVHVPGKSIGKLINDI